VKTVSLCRVSIRVNHFGNCRKLRPMKSHETPFTSACSTNESENRFLGDLSIHRNKYLKLQNVDKVDGTRHKAPTQTVMPHSIVKLHTLVTANWEIVQKNGFHNHNQPGYVVELVRTSTIMRVVMSSSRDWSETFLIFHITHDSC